MAEWILSNHSPVDGELGCFHNLAIVSSAAINICVQVYCMLTCILLDICLGVAQQDPMVIFLVL
jgi:hypothetical protein